VLSYYTSLRSEFRVVMSYYTSLRSEFRVVMSYYTSLRSEFRVVMSVTISHKNDVWFGIFTSSLFTYSGVHHILCFSSCNLCCQFL
jgi:hypothetical protein